MGFNMLPPDPLQIRGETRSEQELSIDVFIQVIKLLLHNVVSMDITREDFVLVKMVSSHDVMMVVISPAAY